MKDPNIIKKDKPELLKMLSAARISLRDLRFGSAGSKDKNVKKAKSLKKDIARIETILRIKN